MQQVNVIQQGGGMRMPSHEIRKFTVVMSAHEVEQLRRLLKEDETITCLIKRLLREAASVAA